MLISPLNYEKLVEPVISVLVDAELRDELIMNGTRTADAYSLGNTALRHEEFYSGILEGVMPV